MKTISVEIFGASYSIKTKEDPAYTKNLAKFLDKQMREVYDKSSVLSTTKIAILAMMNIADELHKHKVSISEQIEEEVEKRAEYLLNIIDKSEPR